MINNIRNNTISDEINKLNKLKSVETKVKRVIDTQKTLLSMFDDLNTIFNDDNNNKIVNEDNNVNDNDNYDSDDDYDSNDDHDEQYYEIRQINRSFKKIDETKSFEEQIDILKKLPRLHDYWYMNYYEDNKETLFKSKVAHVFNDVDDNLFKEIFGLTSVKLVDKLLNTTSKEENEMLINNIKKNEDKIFEQDEFSKFVIKQA